MPGPRGKTNAAKKNKKKAVSQDNTALGSISPSTVPEHVLVSLNELSNDGWDKVAKVLCDHLELPDLTTRKGLKKVYHDFDETYERMNNMYVVYEANQFIRGGIIAIYVKMCADSILRNMLCQRGLLSKIVSLIDTPNATHIALRALATVTQHGGSNIRRDVSTHTPILIRVLQNSPDDLYAAELVISTIAHVITCSPDEPQEPTAKYAKYAKILQLPKLIPLILGVIGRPAVSLPLLHHALELFGSLTHHCAQDCLAFPDMIDFLIACIRSADMHSRLYALGSVIHLSVPDSGKIVYDPRALMAAVKRGLPDHLTDLLLDYGPARCEMTLTVLSLSDHQKAMMQCLQDHDLYKLGRTLAELVLRNEFSICEGGFQAVNQRTGRVEDIDTGLPFKMWVDALPVCAKSIRERGKAGEEDLADILAMKYFVIRSRIPEAIMIAKGAIERNPRCAYPYYIMSLGADEQVGLRSVKKGLKCKNMTPFVNHVLRARATEIAGNLALCHVQESAVGDQNWEQAQALVGSALEDAQIYLDKAPPDMRHQKSILYWYILLTLAQKGPELSHDLCELKKYNDKLKICDEFFAEFGIVPPRSQLRFAHERIFSRYTAAVTKWGTAVAQLETYDIDEFIISRDKAEDKLASWLTNMQEETMDDVDHDNHPHRSSHIKCPKKNPMELHRCSWCGNPSAVLRKCGGCEKARYCDTSCQKLAWLEHKVECKKSANSSA